MLLTLLPYPDPLPVPIWTPEPTINDLLLIAACAWGIWLLLQRR